MARRRKRGGPKRKFDVPRKKNGQPKQRQRPETNVATRKQRMVWVGDWDLTADPLAGTALGCVLLRSRPISDPRNPQAPPKPQLPDGIDDAQHRAGEQFASLVERWRRLRVDPPPEAKIAAIDGAKGRSLAKDPSAKDGERAQEDYDAAQAALERAGTRPRGEVRGICEGGRHPGWLARIGDPKPGDAASIKALVDGLEALAVHFKIRRQKAAA